MQLLASVPLLIIDDLGMRKLPVAAAEELLEIVMLRYERTALCSLQIDPWKTGVSYWEIVPPSPQCSIAFSITVMYSNVVLGVGVRK